MIDEDSLDYIPCTLWDDVPVVHTEEELKIMIQEYKEEEYLRLHT